jgi:tetratricopeptide (TPR) repeat protein
MWLLLASQIQDKAKRHTVSYQFAKRVTDVSPQSPIGWLNLGYIQDQLYLFDDAEASYRKGMSVAATDEQKGTLMMNWSACLINRGSWADAEEMARNALRYRPDSHKAKANLGMACLAARNWKEGWKLYDSIIGYHDSRRKVKYNNEPDWDGRPGQKVVVYGEQGLGDEISFASMIPDAIDRAGKIIIDCEPRLQGLFARSFPRAKVYGTLKQNRALVWDVEDTKMDASCTSAALGKLFRNDAADFDGEPYLIPDPDRVAMWKGLFAKQGKPVIGVAWSGGVAWTADRYRKLDLEQLLPVFRSVDAVWVCLQYKDAGKEIQAFRQKHPEVDLRQYAFGTLTKDYDDTAALVAALDGVVSMQTTVIHLAGALGIPTQCLVNMCGQWRYGIDGDDMPWYKSVKLYRQTRDRQWPIDRVAADLAARWA